ncbi:MAG: TonB family protein [Bryobacteraceae bacterium]
MFVISESACSAVFLGAALKSIAVLCAAWLMALALRKRSAASRHLVWTAAAAALVALPLLSISVPALRVPTGGLLAAVPGITFHAGATASAGGPITRAASSAARPAAPAPSAPWRLDLTLCLMLLWTAGSALALAQMLLAYTRLCRIRRAAPPYPAPQASRSLARALGIGRPVEVLETSAGTMPMAFGLRRSTILMPAGAQDWTEERRRVVLLHELAHVRRADGATHLLARLALSLFWWNPLAWSAWRQFLKERERAADDLVLTAGEPAADYAGHLLEVARSLQFAPTASVAVAMARRSDLEGRLRAILDSAADRTHPGRASALAAALVAIALVVPLAALRAQDPTDPKAPDVEATIRAAVAQKNYDALDQAAQNLEKLRQYESARKLLESALAIREELAGTQSASYATGLLKLGDLAAKHGQASSAEDYYSRAVALGDTPEAVPALLFLANRALGVKNYQQSEALAQRALSLAPTGSLAARELLLKGNIALAQDLSGMAESYYLQALGAVKPGSTDSAFVMETYAQLMRKQSRLGEADAMADSAATIRKAHIAELAPRHTMAATPARVGNGVAAPVLVSKVEPEYSEEARVAKIQGTVVLTVVIGVDGHAADITLARSIGFGLDEKALDAVMQWQFKPGTQNGLPVPVTAQIEINFRLL